VRARGQWRALPGHDDFELTVNLSARQLANADLFAQPCPPAGISPLLDAERSARRVPVR
jgi:hypothetical protein